MTDGGLIKWIQDHPSDQNDSSEFENFLEYTFRPPKEGSKALVLVDGEWIEVEASEAFEVWKKAREKEITINGGNDE